MNTLLYFLKSLFRRPVSPEELDAYLAALRSSSSRQPAEVVAVADHVAHLADRLEQARYLRDVIFLDESPRVREVAQDLLLQLTGKWVRP